MTSLQKVDELLKNGQHSEAIILARALSTEHPETPTYRLALISSLFLAGEPDGDHELSEYLNLFGDFASLMKLTRNLVSSHKFLAAKNITAHVLNLKGGLPSNAHEWLRQATVLGLYHEALLVIENSNNHSDETLMVLAEIYAAFGKNEEAANIYESLIKKHPRVQKLHFQLAKLRTAKDDNHINSMRTLLDNYPKGDNRRTWLHYSIGKEFEDLSRYQEALGHFTEGGICALNGSGYKISNDLDILQFIQANVTAPPQKNSDTINACKPIFILGLPRTGSTLLERILSNHPSIESVGETYFFQLAAQKVLKQPLNSFPSVDLCAKLRDSDPKAIATLYLELTQHLRTDKEYFIEKLPENFLYVDLILSCFPDATILYTRRDIRDVAMGLFKQPYFRFAYNLDHLSAYLHAHVELHSEYQCRYPGMMHTVHYEQLAKDPQLTATKIFNLLGLNANESTFEANKNPTASNTLSTAQLAEPIHLRSINRYANYIPPLESFFTSLNNIQGGN